MKVVNDRQKKSYVISNSSNGNGTVKRPYEDENSGIQKKKQPYSYLFVTM